MQGVCVCAITSTQRIGMRLCAISHPRWNGMRIHAVCCCKYVDLCVLPYDTAPNCSSPVQLKKFERSTSMLCVFEPLATKYLLEYIRPHKADSQIYLLSPACMLF